jgi:hypothetical protein
MLACCAVKADMSNIPHSLRIEPHEALKRDFTVIIPALNKAGFSNYKLAYLCGERTAESTIRKWAKGETEPVYSKAIVLIALHDLYCGSGVSTTNGGGK